MRVRLRPSRLRCGWCLGDIEGAARRCSSCRLVVHALCASEAGVCPALGCRKGVRHGDSVRIRKLADVRAEQLLTLWVLAALIVWTGVVEEGLYFARAAGCEWRFERSVVEAERPRPLAVEAPVVTVTAPAKITPKEVETRAPTPIEAPISRLVAAPGQVTLRFAEPLVRAKLGENGWLDRLDSEVVFENRGETPVVLMRDTEERGFARFTWTIRDAAGAPVERRWFRMCGTCWQPHSIDRRDFVRLEPHATVRMRQLPEYWRYRFERGLYRLHVSYRLDPLAEKVDEATVPRTGERSRGTPEDEPGTKRLLAEVGPLDVSVEAELWLLVE